MPESEVERVVGGRYEILGLLGEGGMGTVHVARHQATHRKCALKIMRPQMAKDQGAVDRFLREVRAPAAIDHDGIVEVLDAGVDGETNELFFAMEMLLGRPLSSIFENEKTHVTEKVMWLERMLEPLSAAHEKGFVHRDLKPENVFVARQRDGTEQVKLLDFGIARQTETANSITKTGMALGTVYYMSPEQARSARGVTPAADVWAWGVMLYEALTHKMPFDGETAGDIIVKLCTEPFADVRTLAPSTPQPLADLVNACLQKEPEHRPTDAQELKRLLFDAMTEVGRDRGSERVSLIDPNEFGGTTATVVAGDDYLPGADYVPAGATDPQSRPPAPPPDLYPADEVSQPFEVGDLFDEQAATVFDADGPASIHQVPMPVADASAPATAPDHAHEESIQVNADAGSSGGFAGPPVPAKPAGGGSNVGLLVGVGLVVLVALGVGGAFAAGVFDPPPEPPTVGVIRTGTIQVDTDITGADLFLDGRAVGPLVPGVSFPVPEGEHDVEARQGGTVVARGHARVEHLGNVTVRLSAAP